jgi:hypothetical protein
MQYMKVNQTLKCQLHKDTTYELQLRLRGFCHVTVLTHVNYDRKEHVNYVRTDIFGGFN